jgi:hypothetical protein
MLRKNFPRCRVCCHQPYLRLSTADWRLSGFCGSRAGALHTRSIRRFIDRWYTHSAELRHKNIENALGQAKLLKQAIFQRKSLQKHR